MVRTVKLNDGKEIPLIAWGTGLVGTKSGRETDMLGAKAIQVGIPHIDTAEMYGTEEAVRKALADSRVPRDKVWVTTKLWAKGEPGSSSPEQIRKSVQGSIERLGSKPDLLLIHKADVPEKGKIGEYWQTLERLVEEGTLRGVSLGVSNFRPEHLGEVLNVAKIVPAVNQIKYNPYLLEDLRPVLDLGKKHHIITEAYSPLKAILQHPTGGPVKPILTRIAARVTKESGRHVDEAGVLLLWNVAKGVVAVTNTSNPDRLTKIGGLSDQKGLSADEVEEIDAAGRQPIESS